MNFTVFNKNKDGSKTGGAGGTAQVESKTGPQRTNLYPTGTLPSATRETTISVNTNVAAYCRYGTRAGISYNSMSGSFSYNKDKTFHSIKVVGLDPGQTYEYYIRCRDMVGNKNSDDAVVRFNTGTGYAFSGSSGGTSGSASGDVIPPVISNLYPTGTLPGGTSETQMSVATNEAGYCRYSKTANTDYNSMSSNFAYDKAKLVHTVTIVGLEDNKIYDYYVRCRDLRGNKDTSDVILRFGVGGASVAGGTSQHQDITPPYRYSGTPNKNMPYDTKKTLISLKTDENAVCRYDTVSGMSYGQMKILDTTGGLVHSTEIGGFNEGATYKYYVKCADQLNNVNTDDYAISFLVEKPKDVIPPVVTILYPYSDSYFGSTEIQLAVSTNEAASCRYATEQGVAFKSMTKNFTKQEANIHTAKVTNLQPGLYSFFVRCKDTAGNADTGDVMISFRFTP